LAAPFFLLLAFAQISAAEELLRQSLTFGPSYTIPHGARAADVERAVTGR